MLHWISKRTTTFKPLGLRPRGFRCFLSCVWNFSEALVYVFLEKKKKPPASRYPSSIERTLLIFGYVFDKHVSLSCLFRGNVKLQIQLSCKNSAYSLGNGKLQSDKCMNQKLLGSANVHDGQVTQVTLFTNVPEKRRYYICWRVEAATLRRKENFTRK